MTNDTYFREAAVNAYRVFREKRISSLVLLAPLLLFLPNQVWAATGITALTTTPSADGGQSYSVTLQILLLMTALTFLPAVVMMMTSFTRIVIVLSILRQAIGTNQIPSSQIIIGMSLFLSFFIMAPVLEKTYTDAVKPYLDEKLTEQQALQKAKEPIHSFMLMQTRESDLALFADLAGKESFDTAADVPFSTLVPAFVTSELKTAFQIGFMIFVPFVVIDLVVASVLMSMGMMMLSPMLIALPFKLMLFVLVDGWSLIIKTLAASFAV